MQAEPNHDAVQVFFDQWAIYRKVVENNYMAHREAMVELRTALLDCRPGFSFLDLACGDADSTTSLLSTLPVGRYEGIDLCPPALDFARQNGARLACPVSFQCGELLASLSASDRPEDVIYIGFSLHHFPGANKRPVMKAARKRLAAGGLFVFFEPYLGPGETREECLDRFLSAVRASWTALDPAELAAVDNHVSQCDFPEAQSTFETLAAEAGFASARVVYENAFYAMFVCR